MIFKLFQLTRNYISFNVKINIKLPRVNKQDSKEVRNNIQLRFIGSCRFLASIRDKLASNFCDTSGVQCNKCKSDMKLINISGK